MKSLLPPREALKVAGLRVRAHLVCKDTVNSALGVFFKLLQSVFFGDLSFSASNTSQLKFMKLPSRRG